MAGESSNLRLTRRPFNIISSNILVDFKYGAYCSRYTRCHQILSNPLGAFRIVALSKNQALNQDSNLRTSLGNSRRMRVRWENDSKSKIPHVIAAA